jgi:hypothetical protein
MPSPILHWNQHNILFGVGGTVHRIFTNYSAARSALARAVGIGRKVAPVQETEQKKLATRTPRKKMGLKFT